MTDSTDAWSLPGTETVSPSADASAQRKRCAHCRGPFGLVRRRRAARQFCSAACMESYDEALRRTVQAKARWLNLLDRAGLCRLR
jgi:hypothetical protein